MDLMGLVMGLPPLQLGEAPSLETAFAVALSVVVSQNFRITLTVNILFVILCIDLPSCTRNRSEGGPRGECTL